MTPRRVVCAAGAWGGRVDVNGGQTPETGLTAPVRLRGRFVDIIGLVTATRSLPGASSSVVQKFSSRRTTNKFVEYPYLSPASFLLLLLAISSPRSAQLLSLWPPATRARLELQPLLELQAFDAVRRGPAAGQHPNTAASGLAGRFSTGHRLPALSRNLPASRAPARGANLKWRHPGDHWHWRRELRACPSFYGDSVA